MTINSSLYKLQHCAQTYLGYCPDALTISAAAHDPRANDDIRRLALQLLENGLPLDNQGLPATGGALH